MKKRFIRFLSIVLVFLLSFSTFSVPVFADEYQRSIWSRAHKFKTNYTLTGNAATDIVIVASAQANRPASDFNYPGHWCAAFVSDCAIKANAGGSIPYHVTCAYLIDLVKSQGGYEVSTPQAGDLAFYWCTSSGIWCHVAIMKNETLSVHGNCAGKVCDNVKYNDYYDSNGKCYTVTFIRPNYKKIVSTETDCDINLEVSVDSAKHRVGPAETFSEVGNRFSRGTVLHAKKYKYNSYGHLWYKLDDDSWIYEERVKKLSTYSIKYDANGGTGAPATQKKLKNQSVTISKGAPTKKWNRFTGWDDTINKTHMQPGDTYKTNKSTTLKAMWKLSLAYVNLSKYSSEICLNDTSTDTISLKFTGFVRKGSTINLKYDNSLMTCTASDISSKGIDGVGSINATLTIKAKNIGTGVCEIIAKNPDGEIINRSAVHVTVVRKSTIKYDANGGTGAPVSQTKVSDKNLTLSDRIPTRKNYTFMGWTAVKGGTTPEYGPGDLITNQISSDTTLYAIWNENYHIEHTWNADSKTLTITGYGDMAFYSQSSAAPWASYKDIAEKIVICDGVTSVGSYAFYGFSKVKLVDAPLSLKVIYNHAFSNCKFLEEIMVSHCCDIKPYAFAQCKNLSKVNKSANKQKSSRAIQSNSIPEDVFEVGAFAFEGCESLATIDLLNASYIGEGAFSGCSSLNNVIIPEGIDNIEDTVFFNCENLTNISIPESVTCISDGAFQGCTSIESVDIPETVAEIGNQVFSGCTSVESITIPESVEIIGASAFSNCTALTDVSLPESMVYLGDGMFSGCSSLSEIDIPNNISSLGEGTFLGCSSLNSIDLPDNIYKIGNSVFSGCTSLDDISLGDSLTSIDSYAFYGCTGIDNIDIPGSVSELGSCAFARCTSLKTATIPNSVTSINTGAFLGCSSLETVIIEDGAALDIGNEAFAECTSLKNIYVPESATSISETAFARCSNETRVSCFSTAQVLDDIESSGINYNILYHPTNLELDKSFVELKKDDTLKLNAIFTPVNTTNKKLTWASDSEDIATVTQDGVVTAVGSGIAVITAVSEDGNIEAYCEVDCVIPVESIDIVTNIPELLVGSQVELYCSFNPEQPTNIDVVWSSSNPDAVKVNEEGKIEVVGEGTSTITVTTADGNKKDSIVITGRNYVPVDEIKVAKSTLNINIGSTETVEFSVLPSNATDSVIYFYSEDKNIATVSDEGIITGVSEGTTKICFVSNANEEIRAYITVNVMALENTGGVQSVSIDDVFINYRSSANLKPQIDVDEGVKYTVTYSSSNPDVATVDENGNVTAKGRGDAEIIVMVTDEHGNTVTNTCKVEVKYTWWQWIIVIVLFGWIWY